MKLHVVNGSPNSRKALAVASRLRIDLEVTYLEFVAGDLQKPEFLRLNPCGRVPVLEDGDFLLWESNAIMAYLSDMAGADSLYPAAPRARAEIHKWMSWELSHFNNEMGCLGWEEVAKPAFLNQPADMRLVDRAAGRLSREAQVLEGQLAKSGPYLLGDEVTLADYALISTEMFKEMVSFDWGGLPKVNAWYELMRKDPYWSRFAPKPEELGLRPADPVPLLLSA